MGGLGAFFSIGLALAYFGLYVEVDPRLEMVNGVLSGANCGGCGYPGCTAFADALIHGKAAITACPVNTQDGMDELSSILGIQKQIKKNVYARVLCRGGNNETYPKGRYRGIQTCLAAHLTFGGDKLCRYGCLSFGDCVASCPFDAIYIDKNGLPDVSDLKCTGCGNCVTVCPRNIIELHPVDHNLFIFCKSEDEAKYTKLTCTKACNACKSCQKKAGENNISVVNNLARINYDNYGTVNTLPTDKCRNNAIEIIQKIANK
jgi:Na+-translocating ferredoxin:NAD+ oxidoreductase RNF subunit RnfB